MSAIMGILQHEQPINEAVLLNMQQILRHRGIIGFTCPRR